MKWALQKGNMSGWSCFYPANWEFKLAAEMEVPAKSARRGEASLCGGPTWGRTAGREYTRLFQVINPFV